MVFKFKQFSVAQDKCAMKVGTDGVLLGAWATPETTPQTILDIGAGSGLIALMLAQRFDIAQIDGLEIDNKSFEQCVENFENSPWPDRLFCYHASLNEFVEEMQDETYDLIVSNPPFFNTTKPITNSRELARNNTSLSLKELFYSASKLMSTKGTFCLILPFDQEKEASRVANVFELELKHVVMIKGTPDTKVKRVLMQFTNTKPNKLIKEEMVIEQKRHIYTEKAHKLVSPFYINL